MNGAMLKARHFPFQLVAFYAYNQSRNLSPRTLHGYNESLKNFHRWFANTCGVGANITPRRIREFAAQRLASGKAPLTVRTELTALRAFFSFLVLDGVIKEADNPMKLVRNPGAKYQGGRPQYCSLMRRFSLARTGYFKVPVDALPEKQRTPQTH